MNADEIVKRLRDIVYDNEFDAEVGFAASDLIERQVDEVNHWEESHKTMTAIIEQQAKALLEAREETIAVMKSWSSFADNVRQKELRDAIERAEAAERELAELKRRAAPSSLRQKNDGRRHREAAAPSPK